MLKHFIFSISVSLFKKSRQKGVVAQPVPPPEIEAKEKDAGKAALEEEFIKRLEVIEDLSDPKNQEYSRLAMVSNVFYWLIQKILI